MYTAKQKITANTNSRGRALPSMMSSIKIQKDTIPINSSPEKGCDNNRANIKIELATHFLLSKQNIHPKNSAW